MAVTGWRSAGLGQSIPFGTPKKTWSNPTNIYVSDNNRASRRHYQDDITEYLRATTFGFSIPDGAIIDGIEARFEKYCSASNTIMDYSCKIVKAGSEQGTGHAKGYWSTSEGYVVYGGATDKWGLTWTVAQINASNFGVSISAINYESTSSMAYVDHVQIRVYYTEPGTDMKVNVAGVWKDVAEIKINNLGVWKNVTEAWVNVAGVWKQVF